MKILDNEYSICYRLEKPFFWLTYKKFCKMNGLAEGNFKSVMMWQQTIEDKKAI